MKAAFIIKTGGPEVIEWGELAEPTFKDNEVLVKVSAVAVNPIDTYFRSGKYPMPKLAKFPYIIGRDMVGTVFKMGPKATQFKPGERVWSNSLGVYTPQGSFAQYVSVPENLLYTAPSKVNDVDVVAAASAGVTACLGLISAAGLLATDILFVNGGAGNVGSAIIQVAKARGSQVLTSSSSAEKMQWCRDLGADVVLDYRKDNLKEKIKAAVPNGVNVFWDTSRHPDFDLAVAILGHHGRIVLMSGAGSTPPFPVGAFYNKECMMKGFSINQASPEELQQAAMLLNLCLERKQFKTKIAKVLPITEAAKAHAMVESDPDVWGKVVLTV